MVVCRGYTRKEPFANGIWTPKAENWNGRVAMLGFTGIVLTEALAGKSVLQVGGTLFWVSVTKFPYEARCVFLYRTTCVIDITLYATAACNLHCKLWHRFDLLFACAVLRTSKEC